jgi:hypothetical protein
MKQTAVEYLVEQLFPKALSEQQYYHIEKAKQMEYHQITEAFINGEVARDRIDSIEYYKETYGHENK